MEEKNLGRPRFDTTVDPYPFSKEDIMEMMRKEPDRVHYETKSLRRPHIRSVFLDGVNTNYVQCTHCAGGHLFKHYTKYGSGQLLRHEESRRHNRGGGLDAGDVGEEGKEVLKPKEKKPKAFVHPLVWDHCTRTGKFTDLGAEIRSCNYCKEEVSASAGKATAHMKNECLMIPEEMRKNFQVERKRKYEGQFHSSDESDYFEDDGDDKDKVVQILTGLLSKSFEPSQSGNRKPLKNYTEHDFDRELKELAVRKARLEVEDLQDRMRERSERTNLYQEIKVGFRSLVKAVNTIAEKNTESTPDPRPRIPNILLEAYEDSVTSPSINGHNK